ncbi:MAG: methyltransferase domain-containing protein [Gammaproteobacteria bacterium]|nr:methyltransferase domain-containing protein [Gammaproteobacteria bacterium]
MSCCCPHSRSASRFFSFFAGRYRKRFEKKGFEPSQKQLMEGLEQAGYQGLKILEIGSGVGHLHQTLLEQGAKSAVGVDLASKMIDEARLWAKERKLADRTEYVEGDFMEISDSLSNADVTVLDKVVCCYPDADGLVHATLNKTNRIYALTYPRDRWYVHAMMGVVAWVMKIVGSDFRPYVHDPRLIEKWISGAGFEKQYQNQNLVWLSQVYVKVNSLRTGS